MKQVHFHSSDQKIKWFGYGEWAEEPDEVTFEHLGIKSIALDLLPFRVNNSISCYYLVNDIQ